MDVKGHNTRRALAALRAAKRYGGGSWQENLTDLLTDVMHLCRRSDMDFRALVEQAAAHHAGEALDEAKANKAKARRNP